MTPRGWLAGACMAVLAVLAAWTAWPREPAFDVVRAAPVVALPRTEAPAEERARTSVEVEPRTMAEVHALRAWTASATHDDIDELRRVALSARSPIAVGHALAALGRLRALAGDAELLALIDDPRPRVRHELVLALGDRPDAAGALLLARAARSEDPTLRALARLGLDRNPGSIRRE